MTAPLRRASLGLVLAAAVAAGGGPTGAPPAGDASAAADRALLARVIAEGAVERVEPAPSWREYGVDVADAASRWFSGFLGRWIGGSAGVGKAIAYGVLVAAGLAVVAGIVLLAVAAWRRLRARRPEPGGVPELEAAVVAARARTPEAWRLEADARLRDADVAGALHAAWWWFALGLAGDSVDPSWTTRELLRSAGRPDLWRLGLLADRLRFGPAGATVDQVRRLLTETAEALA